MSEDPDQVHSMLQREWIKLLDQALSRIRHCVGQLSPQQLWWQPDSKQNSIGILIRHLAGNLQQWVVDGIPQHENARDRDAEFAGNDEESAEHLLTLLCHVVDSAKQVLRQLNAAELTQPRSIQGFDVTVIGAIMHSVPHFVGHTHQIVQLTRIQLGDTYRFEWDPDGPRDVVSL